MLYKGAGKTLIEWEAMSTMSTRIITAMFRSTQNNINVIKSFDKELLILYRV